jgi:hypothetical protein
MKKGPPPAGGTPPCGPRVFCVTMDAPYRIILMVLRIAGKTVLTPLRSARCNRPCSLLSDDIIPSVVRKSVPISSIYTSPQVFVGSVCGVVLGIPNSMPCSSQYFKGAGAGKSTSMSERRVALAGAAHGPRAISGCGRGGMNDSKLGYRLS